MARYLVEQIFPEGLDLSVDADGARQCLKLIHNNALEGVTWIHSYVAVDKRMAFYICDAPNPEAIRVAAEKNGLPVDRIIQVQVLDPYFYR